MSLETWKEEFYPIDAEYVSEEEDAVAHSLRKWIGLRKENLDKHRISSTGWIGISDGDEYVYIDSSTCALCQRYFDDEAVNECASCPLFDLLGKRCDNGDDSPFVIWGEYENPEPMIAALKQLVEQDGEHSE